MAPAATEAREGVDWDITIMDMKNKKLLKTAAECFRYFRSRLGPDVVLEDISVQGGIELEYSYVVVAADFAVPLASLTLDLAKCREMCCVLRNVVFDAVQKKGKKLNGWLDAYYCSLYLVCSTLAEEYVEMPDYPAWAVAYLLSHAVEEGDDAFKSVVLDLFKEVAILISADSEDDFAYGLARILDVCIVYLGMKELFKRINVTYVDWRKYIETETPNDKECPNVEGYYDDTSMKAVLQRMLLKHLNAAMEVPYGQVISAMTICSNLASFLSAGMSPQKYTLKDIGIDDDEAVGGNDSIQPDSRPEDSDNENR